MQDNYGLCDFEIQILQECAGERRPSDWGAAVGAALSFLKGKGLIDHRGKLTPAGEAFYPKVRDFMPSRS